MANRKQSKAKPLNPSSAATPPAAISLDRALDAGDLHAVEVALDELVARQPDWPRMIAYLKSLSDVVNPKTDLETFVTRCKNLLAAAYSLDQSQPIPLGGLKWIETLALITSRSAAVFARLREFLKSLSFFADSLSTQTFRLAVFLESQSRQAHRMANERGIVEGTYHPYAILDQSIQTPTGGKTSILDNYEIMVEATELVLRYAYYVASTELRSAPFIPKTPFDDPDLTRTLRAAEVWNELVELLSAVKYGGWTTHRLSLDHACYAPHNEAEYTRYRVGQIREQAIIAEFFANQTNPKTHYERGLELSSLAHEIEYPLTGQTWNGQYPRALGDLIKADKTLADRAASWISFRHYDPFTRALRIDGGGIGWQQWFAARNALDILATVFAYSLKPPGQETDDDDWCRYVVVARRRDLIRLAQETGISKREAEAAINALVFDQRRRSLELWDQPLLPLTGDRVVIIPSLIGAANPTRVLENAIAQWSSASVTARGLPYETDILSDIRAHGFGAVQKNVTITDADNKTVEYDLVWWWAGHLFLIETKCLQSVHGFADYARAKVEIEGGFEQLRRRRRAIRAQWDQFRAAANQLPLPGECPPDTRITGIVLTNITYFTTWATDDGLIVIDDVCFRRYFSHPSIDAYSQQATGGNRFLGHLGSIRSSSPSPASLITYFHDPQQCQRVRRRLEATMVQSPASETSFPVWRLSLDYHPDLREWIPSR